jgi:hypothetical protein
MSSSIPQWPENKPKNYFNWLLKQWTELFREDSQDFYNILCEKYNESPATLAREIAKRKGYSKTKQTYDELYEKRRVK